MVLLRLLARLFPGMTIRVLIRGEVASIGTVNILEGGSVIGSIMARKIIVSGVMDGKVKSSDALEVQAGGTLKGDVIANAIQVDSGAQFQGFCRIGSAETIEKLRDRADGEARKSVEPSRWFWQK